MTRGPFEVARLDDLQAFADELVTIPIRIPLGVTAFGVNAYRAREPGGPVIEEHDELGPGAGKHEELYLVLSGHAAGRGARPPRARVELDPRTREWAREDSDLEPVRDDPRFPL